MNKIIKSELEKVRVEMTPYDDTTTFIKISKKNSSQDTPIEIGHVYRIMLEDYIINEPPNFTLSSNWNNGIKPASKYLNIRVVDISGTMIQVNACGFDIILQCEKDDSYIGLWLPRNSVTVLGEYK